MELEVLWRGGAGGGIWTGEVELEVVWRWNLGGAGWRMVEAWRGQ